MKKLILALIIICFSTSVLAVDYCEGIDEYSAIFKKEIASFQIKIDNDLNDPKIAISHKNLVKERLKEEKIMCQVLVKKHTYNLPSILNDGVQSFIVKESAIMYHEGRSQKELNSARMLLIACYCQLRGHYK